MRNVAPSRSLVRRANQFRALAFLIGALGVFTLTLGLALTRIPLAAPNTGAESLTLLTRSGLQLLGLGFIVVAVALAIRAFTWKTDNDLAKIMARNLAPILDDSYTLIRNVSNFSIGYVDAVLVGPPGVMVFRLVDRRGVFINEGSNWMTLGRTPTELLPARINPTSDTLSDMAKIRQFLERHGLQQIPMYGMIVFMQDPPATQISRVINPSLPSTHLSGLYAAMQRDYLTQTRLDKSRSEEVVRLLYGDRVTPATVPSPPPASPLNR